MFKSNTLGNDGLPVTQQLVNHNVLLGIGTGHALKTSADRKHRHDSASMPSNEPTGVHNPELPASSASSQTP